eukprot:TRINITY_DN1748_c0_g2_i2.p1 TRINITY_DN1748_c0_g2~~TRINITY_DN1748_c0_g2_i2.p1  ORF type:complete len:426 (+),score=39.50 TRINITY_DN1748_c0_g2_i2:108-1385(+)
MKVPFPLSLASRVTLWVLTAVWSLGTSLGRLCSNRPRSSFSNNQRVLVWSPSFDPNFNPTPHISTLSRSLLSIIIPCHIAHTTDYQHLHRVLLSILRLRLPNSFELGPVVVVDDGSPIELNSLIETIFCVAQNRFELILLRQTEAQGFASARNLGLGYLENHYPPLSPDSNHVAPPTKRNPNKFFGTVFLEIENLPSEEWLEEMVHAAVASGTSKQVLVAGRTIAGLSAHPILELYHNLHGTYNPRVSADGEVLYGCAGNLLVSWPLIDSGLRFSDRFPNSACSDVEISLTAKQNRAQVVMAEQACVWRDVGSVSVARSQRFGRFLARCWWVLGMSVLWLVARLGWKGWQNWDVGMIGAMVGGVGLAMMVMDRLINLGWGMCWPLFWEAYRLAQSEAILRGLHSHVAYILRGSQAVSNFETDKQE